MANTKISDLPVATSLTDADIIPIVQSNVTKRTTVDAVLDKADARFATTIANDFSGGFTTPAMLNNFTVADVPLKIFGVGYEQRQVYFTGTIDCSLSGASGSFTGINMFRLPVAYRPKSNLRFTVPTTTTSTSLLKVDVAVTTDGYVTIYPGGQFLTGVHADINLAPISYFISPT